MIGLTPRILTIAVVVLPFLYWPGLYDFTRWPRLLALQVLLAAACLGFVRRRGEVLRIGTWSGLVLAYLAWSALSAVWAVNLTEALIQLNQLFAFVVLGLIASTVASDEVSGIALAWCGAATVAASVGICQYLGIGFAWLPTVGNPSATFGYRNFAASYAIVTLPVAVAGAAASTRGSRRLLFGAASVCLALFLIYTRTRGAWLGIGVAGLLALGRVLCATGTTVLWRTRSWVFPMVAVAVVIGLGALPERMVMRGAFTFDERKTDVATTLAATFSPQDARGRLTVWRHTVQMWLDHPIGGVGIGSWPFVYPEYDRGDWITTNVAPSRPHNDWIWTLAETGLPGLLLLLGVLAVPLWSAIRLRAAHRDRAWILGLACGVLALGIHAFFSFPRERIVPSAMSWMAMGLIAALVRPSARAILPGRILVAAVPLLLLGASLTYRMIGFDASYMQAIMAWQREDWSSAVHHAESALTIGPYNYRAYQILGAGLQQMGREREARDAFEESLRYHPNEGHLPLARILETLGLNEEAAGHYASERKLYPRSLQAALGQARTLLRIPGEAGALAVLQDARGLSAGNPEALAGIAAIWESVGDFGEAAIDYRAALEAGGPSAALHTRLAHALDRAGRPAEALVAYRRAVELEPADARYRNNLGAALVVADRPREAEGEYRKAIGLAPEYARAYFNLGDLLSARGDTAEAIAAYRAFGDHWQGDERYRSLANQKIKALER